MPTASNKEYVLKGCFAQLLGSGVLFTKAGGMPGIPKDARIAPGMAQVIGQVQASKGKCYEMAVKVHSASGKWQLNFGPEFIIVSYMLLDLDDAIREIPIQSVK